jgi:large subunit ribosomal protein L18
MKHIKLTNKKRLRRVNRVRATIVGTALRPRLAVHRSNRFMYAQLIDDAAGRTLAAAHSAASKEKKTKSDGAFAVGESLAKKAVEKNIHAAVFDRRSYKFHGRVKSVAEGAKKGGLKI